MPFINEDDCFQGNVASGEFDSLRLWPWASLIAQLVKNLPVMQETVVQFLGGEDLLKK